MGRSYVTDQITLLDNPVVRECYMIDIGVSAELRLRYNDSNWDLEYPYGSGVIWTGAGDAIKVELPDEDATLAANPCVIYLSATNAALTSLVLSKPMANSGVYVYHALFTENYQIPWPPVMEFAGRWSHAELMNVEDEDD